MNKKQLIALCTCNIGIFAGLSSLAGLMPIYLKQLGADAEITGFFLAFAFLALAVSNILGGRLSERFKRRKPLLMLGGVLAIPLSLVMSGITNVVALMILAGCLWFLAGTAMTMIVILGGLFSDAAHRGRVFGILGLSANFGLIVGNTLSGPAVDRWGYPALFMLLAAFYLLIPIATLFVQDKPSASSQQGAVPNATREIFKNRTFLFFFVGSILGQATNSVIFLTRPLIMDQLGFTATAITMVASIGGLVTLSLPPIIGWLSDKIGRRPVMILCFITTPVGLIILAASVEIWGFGIASALQTILGMSLVAGSAMIVELFPEEWVGTALSLANSTPWIGIVLGLSSVGVALKMLPTTSVLIVSMVLSLVATVLLIPLAEKRLTL